MPHDDMNYLIDENECPPPPLRNAYVDDADNPYVDDSGNTYITGG